jgi:hypothetical protein
MAPFVLHGIVSMRSGMETFSQSNPYCSLRRRPVLSAKSSSGETRWPERSVAFHRWGSATNTESIALLGCEKGVHLILANPPWRQLQERAQKIQGDKKHVEGLSRKVIALRSSIEHRIVFRAAIGDSSW